MNNICYQKFIVKRHWTSMEMNKKKIKHHYRHHHHYNYYYYHHHHHHHHHQLTEIAVPSTFPGRGGARR